MSALNMLQKEAEATQVVIMAGGEGKRMGFIGSPKPLIPLNGEPLIDRCIRYFLENGFKDFTVLTRQDEVVKHVGDGSRYGLRVSVCIDPPLPKVGKGKALKNAILQGAVKASKRLFIAFPDDVFLDRTLPLQFLLSHLEATRRLDTWASVAVVTGLQLPYGVVELDPKGLAVKFEEKPILKIYASVGLYILEPPAIEKLIEIVDMNVEKAIEFENTLLPTLAEQGKLHAFPVPLGTWLPVNTIKELEEAAEALKKNSCKD
ncbi:MAG: sugar phosphate nucleotidyltransferase [Thermofilaceae archaeon]|nr:sugar phosphate nucleotidyltransferase [Thermofilaceae archaeon]